MTEIAGEPIRLMLYTRDRRRHDRRPRPDPQRSTRHCQDLRGDDGEVTTVQPGEAKCSWCGQDLQVRRGGSPQRFCSTEHRSLLWSNLRRWGARAVAAGILTIADIRNGHPAACTLPGAPVSRPLVAEEQDDFDRLLDEMDEILGNRQSRC
jgi:hypothetical protein